MGRDGENAAGMILKFNCCTYLLDDGIDRGKIGFFVIMRVFFRTNAIILLVFKIFIF